MLLINVVFVKFQVKPDNPLKEVLYQETEASGSEGLREYGPPKVEINQGLPDEVTEQLFSSEVVETKSEVAVEEKETITEGKSCQMKKHL